MKPWIRFFIVILLPALISCGGGGADNTEEIIVTDQDLTIALGDTGHIYIPNGSVAANTEISVELRPPPVLSDSLTAVGETYSVSLNEKVNYPIEVSLPVPTGEDPDKLVLFRLEDNGRISLLDTRLEDGHLKAFTPGFSAVGAALHNDLTFIHPKIKGADTIPVGSVAKYSEINTLAEVTGLSPDWKLYDLEPVMESTLNLDPEPLKSNIAFVSAENSGKLRLLVQYVDPTLGFNVIAHKDITVQPTLKVADRLSIDILGPNMIIQGEDLILQASILNTDADDTSAWSWSFDGFTAICDTVDCTNQQIIIPTNDISVGTHDIDATHHNTGSSASISVKVIGEEVRIINNEITSEVGGFIWNELLNPELTITASVDISGGQAPYSYQWRIDPGILNGEFVSPYITTNVSSLDEDTFTFSVDQPGVHGVYIKVTDSHGDIEKRYSKFTVEGGSDLSYDLQALPESVQLNKAVSTTFRMFGGGLIRGGSFQPTRSYWLDWGDDSIPDYGELSAITVQDPVKITLQHTYQKPGDYTIHYFAIDDRVTGEGGINAWVQEYVDINSLAKETITVVANTISYEEPVTGGCPMLYDPSLDTDNYSGLLEININDKDNDGRYEDRFSCSYWPSGQLQWDREVIDNKLNGHVIGYFETGETQKVTPYTNGQIEGTQIEYFASGQIKKNTPYVNHVEHGVQEGFYESGNPESTLPFTNGDFDGLYLYYYDSPGVLQAKIEYSNSLNNGVYILFAENGQKLYEYFYLNDELDGEQKEYSDTGSLISCTVWLEGIEDGSCMP